MTPQKNRMRRIIISGLSCLLFMLLVFAIIACVKVFYIPVKIDYKYNNVYNNSMIDIKSERENFTVLKISDTHLINGKTQTDLNTLKHIKAALNKKSCDLVILNGDIVDGFNVNLSFDKYTAIDSLADIFESREIFWTFAPGNNDREMQGGNRKMICYLMQYEHFIIGSTLGVDGDVNFTINITRKGEVAHSMVFLDSHSRRILFVGGYDHIKESQIDYLKGVAQNHNTYISVFFHMPTAMFGEAYSRGALLSDYHQSTPYPYDQIKNSDLFDKGIADCANISLLSTSHIHSNNMLAFYNQRYYEQNSASGYGANRDQNIKPVVTEININLLSTAVENLYVFNQH